MSDALPPLARAAELFDELVELDREARSARLAAIALEDPALHGRLLELLVADGRAAAMIDAPAGVSARGLVRDWVESDGDALTGSRIGAYRLVEVLGRGGMGEVWRAERADGAFEQTVALKLLKRGMDSDAVLSRFRRERQILARLTHPGIARLYDGGLAEDGRPYFVLEKVDGEPITEHARRRALPIAARVELLIAASDAVDAAHRQLVVHRDLKPSNVLVDSTGAVKLLDFGIAKLLDDDDGSTALTRLGERALTPAYAAPEQILGEPVTTATDVWALGALLSELLTGRLPRGRESSSGIAQLAAEAERATAPRLSTLARQLAPEELERLALPARERHRLERTLAGDLETIAARALDRDPARRYPSAAALGDDLRRYLDGRPVLARPDSALYRARRFVKRHRVGVAAAALVVLSLVAGLGAALWQAGKTRAALAASEANARRAERTRDFLISLFAVADPLQSGGRSVTAGDLLDQGAKRLESELADDPALRADLLEAVSRIQTSLGMLEPAERSAGSARSLRDPGDAVAGARIDAGLGAIRLQQGNLDEAGRLLDGAIAVLAAAPAGSVPPLVLARVRSDASQVLFWRKRSAEALAAEREVHAVFVRELGADHVETALHLRNTGVILDDLGRLDEAEAVLRDAQARLLKSFGADHPTVAQGDLDLGSVLFKRGRPDETIALVRHTIEVRRRTLGDRHMQTAQAWQNLGYYLAESGRWDEANEAAREALAIFRSINPQGFEVAKCLSTLGNVAGRRGDLGESEKLLRESIAVFAVALGPDHPFYWWTSGSLANVLAKQERFREAEALHREVLAGLERVSGAESADAQWAHEILAETLRKAGRAAEADASAAREKAIAAKLAAPS